VDLLMRALVRRFHSPEIFDLEAYRPADPSSFGFLLQVLAGTSGEDGEDSFNVIVCTPRWLEERYRSTDVVLLRHHLLVSRYDWSAIARFITGYVRSCEGETWQEVATKIGRLGHWEFEDHSP
jgi:hypothetical protein